MKQTPTATVDFTMTNMHYIRIWALATIKAWYLCVAISVHIHVHSKQAAFSYLHPQGYQACLLTIVFCNIKVRYQPTNGTYSIKTAMVPMYNGRCT